MIKRLITKKEEQAYRLCHHNFGGLTTNAAAEKMGVCSHSVARHLKKIKRKFPQLFPILTKRQADVYHMFVNVGMEQKAIAGILGISKNNVATAIYRLRNKGMYVPRKLHQVLYMPRAHDHQIRQKF